MSILVAGGGIAGLAFALTCHQIGQPVTVFEQIEDPKPLGVGINLQPNAVRELFELGLGEALDALAIRTGEVAYFSRHGNLIWSEPRGMAAGYDWPQYSVHRGRLQMLLLQAVRERLGEKAVISGLKAASFENTTDGVVLHLENRNGSRTSRAGSLLIGADGIHSRIRALMNPQEGPPIWGGAVLWRSTSLARPFLSGATMAMAGHEWQKFVAYPIGAPNSETGLVQTNWIAELKRKPDSGWNREDWNREGVLEDFLPAFRDWRFDWLDIPALVQNAGTIYEYPMVDRDPLDNWRQGQVSLIGDAAHAMYPIGSNGASQAILDARTLGRCLAENGPSQAALARYEDERRPATTRIVLSNRNNGPDQIMQIVEERCAGVFSTITDVMSRKELETHASRYKRLAGFDPQRLNTRPPIIDPRFHHAATGEFAP